jgi:hypothetical protein
VGAAGSRDDTRLAERSDVTFTGTTRRCLEVIGTPTYLAHSTDIPGRRLRVGLARSMARRSRNVSDGYVD